MKYLGWGFIPGIPARDLTDEEVERFGAKLLEDSGLYQKTKSSGRGKKEEPVKTIAKDDNGGDE